MKATHWKFNALGEIVISPNSAEGIALARACEGKTQEQAGKRAQKDAEAFVESLKGAFPLGGKSVRIGTMLAGVLNAPRTRKVLDKAGVNKALAKLNLSLEDFETEEKTEPCWSIFAQ